MLHMQCQKRWGAAQRAAAVDTVCSLAKRVQLEQLAVQPAYPEGRLEGRHLVQHTASCPHVSLEAIPLTSNHLRGEVVRRAHERVRPHTPSGMHSGTGAAGGGPAARTAVAGSVARATAAGWSIQDLQQ